MFLLRFIPLAIFLIHTIFGTGISQYVSVNEKDYSEKTTFIEEKSGLPMDSAIIPPKQTFSRNYKEKANFSLLFNKKAFLKIISYLKPTNNFPKSSSFSRNSALYILYHNFLFYDSTI